CAPPELRIPREFLDALGHEGGMKLAVGPHGSVTPKAALEKLGVDALIRGECEEALTQLASAADWRTTPSIAYRNDDDIVVTGPPAATRFIDLPALHWPDAWIARHDHHHHRFGTECIGPGAEVEASRGCPYSC